MARLRVLCDGQPIGSLSLTELDEPRIFVWLYERGAVSGRRGKPFARKIRFLSGDERVVVALAPDEMHGILGFSLMRA